MVKAHWVGAVLFTSAAAASAQSFPSRPYIPGGPFEITVDVSPPGLESFVLTGQAFDDNPEDILTMSASTDYFLRFSFTPGNPASFEYRGVDLTYRELGTHVLGIGAADNSPAMMGGGTTLTLRIVPEPTGLCALAVFANFNRRSRSA